MEALKFPTKILKKENTTVEQLFIHKIRPNPYQTRQQFHIGHLEELSKSIALYGILQPISVRKMNSGYYELITGARRLKAAELAGLETIPAIITKANDCDSAVYSFLENIQRQNLNFIEEAIGYKNMLEDYNFTQEELSIKLCKSQSNIANKLRILRLEDSIQKLLLQYQFTERHARALLRLPYEHSRLIAMDVMIQHDLNVRKTEELIDAMLQEMTLPLLPKIKRKEKRSVNDIRLCTNTIKQAVELIQKNGVEVSFEHCGNDSYCEITIHIRTNHFETA